MSVANRYVAVGDVVGFKDFVRRSTLRKVIESYDRLRKEAEKSLTRRVHKINRPEGYRAEIQKVSYTIFSDTILLWVDVVSGNPNVALDIMIFFDSLGALIAASLKCELPLRVGVAYGECYIDPIKNSYLGEPIINAYLTEQGQEWIGGACHSSCVEESNFKVTCEKMCLVVPYMVPMKTDLHAEIGDVKYAIEWVSWSDVNTNEVLLNKINEINSAPLRTKYMHSFNFYQFIRPPVCLINDR